MAFFHFDEAKAAAQETLQKWIAAKPAVKKLLLVADLFGRLRLVLWSDTVIETSDISADLTLKCGDWWSREVLIADDNKEANNDLFLTTWQEATSASDDGRFAIADRHRSRTAWFAKVDRSVWDAPESGPPVIVFYSFKGGLGRSTALASFAIQRANRGERVCVVDFDLDSPGLGSVLSADIEGHTAAWGVVDFLIEHGMPDVPLPDYFHRCNRASGAGELLVFPAGRIDEHYMDKLARVDLEEPPASTHNGLVDLLRRARDQLEPNWILLDARTGVSEPAGQLLSGLAHLHVLIGTTQDQSWQGLKQVLDRLGKERILRGLSQNELFLVQAMVPVGEAGKQARSAFLAQSQREFSDRYYAESGEDELEQASFWSMSDFDSMDAPHVPSVLEYDPRLAAYGDIEEVLDILQAEPYATIGERIAARFSVESSE